MPATNELQVEEVAAAFDSVARDFEETLENDITRAFRQRVYETIRSLVPPGSRILDINCGIGIDAVSLAQQGYRTSGLDISPGMIAQARERAKNAGTGSVEFFVSSFNDLSKVSPKSFDLILSNFGGLNCAASLEQCAAEVARSVRPGGYFIAVVMPKVSLWEVVAGISRLNFRWGFRRFAREVQATGFRGNTFTVSYYSPRSFKRFFARLFTVCSIRGMNVLSPPPHAVRFRSRHPFLSAMLERWEPRVAAFPLIRSVGDHFMIVLQRSDTEHSE
jgi:ubiquinone/menaquinone biosynthesis C-methylase UbiE